MRKILFFLSFQFLFYPLFAQNINYAREIIDTLTSEYFSGRGAVDDGEKKAANYLATQFKIHGLKSFENTFFQEFKSPINTFPKRVTVSFDGKEIIPGIDFIVDAASGGVNGKFELFFYREELIPNKIELDKLITEGFFFDKFIVLKGKNTTAENEVFQELKHNKIGAAGIVFIENKLTQHLSYVAKDYPILHVKKGVLKQTYKSIFIEIDQKLLTDYRSQNVIAYIKGTEHPDSLVVLSAHYDHLGRMGEKVYFPGANDNASGVAMLLNFAEHYIKHPPKKTIVFIAFGAEESGLVGSKYFVNHPTIPLNQINFVFNMDLMGTGSEGAMIVNGKIYKNHFENLVKINSQHKYLSVIKKRGEAANSDHYWFSEKGVPAFFMYLMGGISAYHDVDDVAITLPLTKFEGTFRLIRDFVDEL